MLNHRNCQSIAETASNIIGHSVLLTGNDGVVLGSSDRERVGTLHEASLEVIRTGCQSYHDEQQAKAYQGTRPGTTIPIIINEEVVGSIGITGQPGEISKYGILIRKLAEVFIKDQLEMESARLLDLSRQNLLRELITFDPNIMEEKAVLDHGHVFGYDLLLPRVAVLIEASCPDEPNDAPFHRFENTACHSAKRGFLRFVVDVVLSYCLSHQKCFSLYPYRLLFRPPVRRLHDRRRQGKISAGRHTSERGNPSLTGV